MRGGMWEVQNGSKEGTPFEVLYRHDLQDGKLSICPPGSRRVNVISCGPRCSIIAPDSFQALDHPKASWQDGVIPLASFLWWQVVAFQDPDAFVPSGNLISTCDCEP